MHVLSRQQPVEEEVLMPIGKLCHDSVCFLCVFVLCCGIFIPNRTQSGSELVSLNFETSFMEVNNVLAIRHNGNFIKTNGIIFCNFNINDPYAFSPALATLDLTFCLWQT